jgi:hypothetical protein
MNDPPKAVDEKKSKRGYCDGRAVGRRRRMRMGAMMGRENVIALSVGERAKKRKIK